MKRIYMTLALLGAFFTGANAQSVDLEAVIGLPTAGQVIGPNQSLDTSKVICGVFYNGPDPIFQGSDFVVTLTSFDHFINQNNVTITGFGFNADLSIADTGLIYVFPNANELGTGHTAPVTVSSDSIRLLFDWDLWNLQDSMSIIEPPYENGKSYGFFFRVLPLSDDNLDPIATDPNPSNNIAVQRIVWNSGVGIGELFPKKAEKALMVYPVPATNNISMEFSFDAPSHAQAFVRDMTGRVVLTKNYGRTLSGVQKFDLDISKLPNGMYTVEFDTDVQTGKAKFTISR